MKNFYLICYFKLSPQIDTVTWNKWASRSWLIALVAATILDIIKLQRFLVLMDRAKQPYKKLGLEDDIVAMKTELHTLQMNFLRDFCDMFIPLSALQYVSPGLGAVCGFLSSIVGFQLEWEKHIQPYKPN